MIQILYGADFIFYLERCPAFWLTTHLRPYRYMFSDIWWGKAGNIEKLKKECQNTENSTSVCLFLSVSSGPLFSSYPQTHLSDWEDFSCTDSLLSPSACSQAKVTKHQMKTKKLYHLFYLSSISICGMVITTEIMFVSSPSYYGRLRDRAILLFYLLSHDLNLAKVVFWGLVSVLRKSHFCSIHNYSKVWGW